MGPDCTFRGLPPRHRRLDVDERRRRLLEVVAGLFARHADDELSMHACTALTAEPRA